MSADTRKKFFNSIAWAGKRTQALKRDGYMCAVCKRYGKRKPATVVHHIRPIEFFWELRLKLWNLISLCDECHNKMHDRQTHQLTAEGQKLIERYPPPLSDSETT